MKNLVIVESPSKCKTIEKYLGKDYKVLSSKGHIRDLATTGKFGLGVDLENNFKPDYKIVKGKSALVKSLKKEAMNSDYVILATDPDREGEAISWHLKDTLDLDKDKYGRVVFNEITKSAIEDAFKNPHDIDINLVQAQESRRILDRIIGFRLSKLMQRKTEGKSAGRVQSVALKIIVDREREINDFVPVEYWTIETNFNDFTAKLEKYGEEDIEIPSETKADKILSSLSNAYKIESVESKEKNKKSKFPFTTSTLTQMASNRFGFKASKTMRIAQKLYEGIELENETVGLITYMRTDSTRFSDDFIKQTYAYIDKNYGKEYVGYVKKSKNNANVQDAHEAIRPTSINRTPDQVKKYLTPDEYKLYNLIYIRSISALMSDAKTMATTVILDNNNYKFKVTGSVLIFDGYLKVYGAFEDTEDKILPDLENYKSNILVSNDVKKEKHYTEAPARYTEAKLIKELERLGIGRPSTYAKIIDILEERKYIEINDKKFYPTEIGITITDKLQEFFSEIINVKYTAQMETDLDKIAAGKEIWYKLLYRFFDEFEPLVEKAFDNMEKAEPETTGELCPNCGKDLVIRMGKYGKFVACSGYPNCKYIKKEEKNNIEICSCPKCSGKIIEKFTKRKKIFYGCSNYPKCNYALWDKPTGNICPTCSGLMVIKKDKEICPVCDKE